MSYSKAYEQQPSPPYVEQGYYVDEKRPQAQNSQDPLDQLNVIVKWLIKIGIVILAAVTLLSGVVGFFLSLLAPICLISNIIMLVVGIIVFIFEAPILCTCIPITQKLAVYSNRIPPWLKMVLYIVPAIAAIAVCPAGGNVWVGALCLVAISLVYFYLTFRRARR